MAPSGSGSLFIGIDVGTSSVKALMSGPNGSVLDTFAASHVTSRPCAGAAEQDPETWFSHVEAALARFAGHPRADEVAVIGITSQVNTHVFCSAKLEPLHPALTWQDTRPSSQAANLDGKLDADAKTAALGAPIPLDASHALARIAWIAENRPEVISATAHVMLPKDFVIAKLTGEVATDPISGVGLVGTDLCYADAVLDLVPAAMSLLPRLADPLDIVGRVRPGHPFAGVQVAVGTMDAWASMFGLGVASEGDAMYLSGTSEVLGLISRERVGAPGIIAFPDWRGITLHAGPTQSGGASLVWLSQLIGKDLATIGQLAGGVRIRRNSPIFLPHLDGERAPLWDPHSRAAFAGMATATGPADLAASVMEGVAFSARLALDGIEISGARKISSLCHGGGGAVSNAWCQIRANALGRTLSRASTRETGAMGALILAAVASGAMSDLPDATRALVVNDTDFAPNSEDSELANERFAMFREMYRDLVSVNAYISGTGPTSE